MRGAIDKIRQRGAELIAISDDADFLASAQTAFPLVPDLPEWLSPLLTVVPGQIAAVELANLLASAFAFCAIAAATGDEMRCSTESLLSMITTGFF